MHSSGYLLATAILAATASPTFAAEMALGDSAVIVYGDAYDGTAHDAAYGNPYSDRYVSSEEVVFMQEADYVATPTDIMAYSPEAVASLYAVETIDGIASDAFIAMLHAY